ncbi:MAG: hypothetical protein JWN02_715, partial [Acidobacteria bacterium]|nr:hypothetical protein [Acidobacteriota bacterium]
PAILLFVMALYPPLGFDETLYHLPIVQSAAATGRIVFLPELRFPLFPQLHEMLAVPAYLALGDTATHLVALMEVLLLAALVWEWGNVRQRHAGPLAAALVLGSPIVVHLATTTFVDPALALFVAAGFRCLDQRDETGAGWYAAAAGFLFGCACSVKYLGGYFAIAALLFLALFGVRRRRTIPLFLAGCLAGVLPMYGRIIAVTGNPVFPYLSGIFGTTRWTLTVPQTMTPLERLMRMLRVPWDLAFARERLNAQPPYTPLLAVALLLVLAAAVREKKAAFLLVMCAVYVAIFTFLPQDSRYLLPLLPLVAVTAAAVGGRWLASRPRGDRATLVIAAIVLVPGLFYAVYRLAVQGPPPVSAEERRYYLEAKVPEYRALEHRGRGRVYVCGAEQLKSYAGDDLLGDAIGLYSSPRILGGADAEELSRRLDGLGVRYLLVSRERCRADWQDVPREPFFTRIYADGGAALWRLSERSRTNAR